MMTVSADTMFVARVPIYGTCDAGRGIGEKRNYDRYDILSTGLKENAVLRALYIYQESGEPKVMLATHVDDMLWPTKPGYEDRIQQLLDHYTLKTVQSATFPFCGRSVAQHPDFSISVRCKDTTEKIELVRYDPNGRKQTDLARGHEVAQLRSVVRSQGWVARRCRPQLSYGVNKLQSVSGTATLDDVRFANCCERPRIQMTMDYSSKAAFLPLTKWRCAPSPTLASETSRIFAVTKGG